MHALRCPRRTCRRVVQQLEADNAELQAELQHLAATLRAALAAAPDGGSLLASVDMPPGGMGQVDGIPPPHNHTHLDLQHAERAAAAAAGGDGAGGVLDWSPPDGASASLLSSFDPAPAASEAGAGPGSAAHGGSGGGAAAPVYHAPTSVSRATLSCSMQHPGSICCSKLSSTVDPSGAACTISLHTTAR